MFSINLLKDFKGTERVVFVPLNVYMVVEIVRGMSDRDPGDVERGI